MARNATAAAPRYEQPKAPEYTVAEQRAITQAQIAKPGEAPGRPQDPMFQQRFATMMRRIQHTGTAPATLVNFLPVRLMVNSSMPELQRAIPACTLQDKYTAYCWSEPIVEAIMSEGVRTPIDYVPRQMAEEYVREYTTEGGPGGVMIFDGTIEQFAEAIDPTDGDPRILAEAREAQEQAIGWMMKRFTEAQNHWNTPQHQMASNITQVHRDCAARLRALGRLGDRDPEWMDIQQSQVAVSQKCPLCKLLAQPDQVVCTNCNYIFDVKAAFAHKLIDENSLLLEKLTRKEVEELGISAFVAETADEAPERLKRGHARPMSKAQQSQFAAMQQQQLNSAAN